MHEIFPAGTFPEKLRIVGNPQLFSYRIALCLYVRDDLLRGRGRRDRGLGDQHPVSVISARLQCRVDRLIQIGEIRLTALPIRRPHTIINAVALRYRGLRILLQEKMLPQIPRKRFIQSRLIKRKPPFPQRIHPMPVHIQPVHRDPLFRKPHGSRQSHKTESEYCHYHMNSPLSLSLINRKNLRTPSSTRISGAYASFSLALSMTGQRLSGLLVR